MPRINLPGIEEKPNRQAHPYPFQIGYQALEFMHASIFIASFSDIASSKQIRRLNGYHEVEEAFKAEGVTDSTIGAAWAIVRKYEGVFLKTVFQNVLISMRSHWDWYISRLGDFVSFGADVRR